MWQLQFREAPTGVPIWAEALDPRAFATLNELEIAMVQVQYGNQKVAVGDLWKVERAVSSSVQPSLRLLGDWSSVDDIGKRLGGGRIEVDGDAGLHLGEGMTGGVIKVHGNVDDFAGRDMAGGRIHIRGNAGDGVGSASIGAKLGMTGGAILVEGSVGAEAGKKMRRGLIAIGGSCGDFVGASMIAGTILVFGTPGRHPGPGMKRGTIAFLGAECASLKLLPTFRLDGRLTPLFLNLFLRRLGEWGFPVSPVCFERAVQRWRGDLLELGKGEILASGQT